MNKIYVLLGMLCFLCLNEIRAQEHSINRITTHAFMLGGGGAQQLDTYLSPMEYTGMQFSIHRETWRLTNMAQQRISHQSLIHATFSYTQNPAGNANDWGGKVGYQAAWHYHWTPAPQLRLMAGGALGAMTGVLYNTRNGNNPAQARLCAELAASIAVIYKWRLKNYPISLRYQADFPVIGAMFSPHFGESYYEISLRGIAHNFVCSHPGNALSIRQIFTIDFPFKHITLRLGYLSDIRQSKVQHIKMHDINRSFLLGFVKHFSILKKKDLNYNNAIL